MSRILAGNVDFEGAPTVGETQSDFRPLQLRWMFTFPILRLTELLNAIFRIAAPDESRFGQNADFEGSPTAGGIQSDSPLQLRGFFRFPILRLRGTFKNVISHIITSSGSHFRRKRRFRRNANCGEIHPYPYPLQLRGVFAFSNFTALRNFLKSNSPNRPPASHIWVKKRRF